MAASPTAGGSTSTPRPSARRRRAADTRWVFLVGQNAVAMGADSVVDAIEGLVPVLGRPGEGSALGRLADGGKTRLAADTAAQAAYLQVVLLGWESAYNRHPDLSARVEIHLGEGTGTTILTGRQVAWLHAALDRCHLRGAVRVTLPGEGQVDRPPGAAVDLDVGGQRLRVPADRAAAAVRPVDAGPVGFALIVAQLLAVVLPGGAGSRSRRRGRDGRLRDRGVVVAPPPAGARAPGPARDPPGSGGDGAGRHRPHLGLVTEPVNADGDTSYIVLGFMLLAFIGGLYTEGLRRQLAVMVGAAAVFIAVLILVLTPGPANTRSFLCAMAYSLCVYPMPRHIGRSLTRATEHHLEETMAEDEQARQALFLDGQESVLALVRLARDDARAQLASVAAQLEPSLSNLVSARLEEVDRRLLSRSRRRVVVVDDNELTLPGYLQAYSACPDFELVGAFGHAGECPGMGTGLTSTLPSSTQPPRLRRRPVPRGCRGAADPSGHPANAGSW